jgi:hypothetical protein
MAALVNRLGAFGRFPLSAANAVQSHQDEDDERQGDDANRGSKLIDGGRAQDHPCILPPNPIPHLL